MNTKTLCSLLISLLIALCFCSCAAATPSSKNISSTDGVLSDGAYYYELKEDRVKIIGHDYDPQQTQITVPQTIVSKPVTWIGQDAFYQHKNVEQIQLPESVTTLEGSPFYRCYGLKTFVVGVNVEHIDSNPFFRCISLQNITVDTDNKHYSDIDGVLFDYEQSVLISYPEGRKDKNYTVPQTVKKLEIDSFGYRPKIETLTILKNVIDFPDGNMFVYPDDITLLVEAGSAAEKYVIENELKYKVIASPTD